jgi:SagB-type dehydrogenase family enzyme
MADASVVLYYVAVLDRVRWKYDFGRMYRIVLLDLGHLSQTVYLVGAALGLGVAFTAATRDEPIEMALRCRPHHDIVLGATAVGVKETDDAVAGAFVPM